MCVTGHSVADLGWELASEIKISDCEQNNMQMTNMQPGLTGSPKLDCLDSNVVVDAGKSAGGTMAMKAVMAAVMLTVTEKKKNVAMHVMVKGEHNDAADEAGSSEREDEDDGNGHDHWTTVMITMAMIVMTRLKENIKVNMKDNITVQTR